MKRTSMRLGILGLFLLMLGATTLQGWDEAPKSTDDKAREATSEKPRPGEEKTDSGLNDARTIAYINEQIEQAWKENKITPSAVANDYEWIRRAFIDTIGRVPSIIPAKVSPKEDPVAAKGE
ncbi:MAG TPA: hypothetical protein PKA06_02370, partial [Gemmatales bacterium]|nr:hypothetical protein [Gemmatales bacterium]